MKNIIKLMEEAGATVYTNQGPSPPVYSFTFTPEQIESLVKRVRNEALTEAIDKARIFSLGLPIAQTERLVEKLESLKEPTP